MRRGSAATLIGLAAMLAAMALPSPAVAENVLLIPEGDENQALSASADADDFRLVVTPDPPLTDGEPELFFAQDLRSEEGKRIPRPTMDVADDSRPITITRAPLSNGRYEFTVTLHADRVGAAGRYTGAAQVEAPGYAPTPLTMTVTTRSDIVVAILYALAGWLVGCVVKAYVEVWRTVGLSTVKLRDYLKLRQGRAVLGAAVFGLFGAFLAFWSSYLLDNNWGAVDPEDHGKLFGAAFSAVITGTSLADVWAKVKPGSSDTAQPAKV